MIERKIINELQAHLSQKEISMIVGPRQAGKTTIMRQLEETLKKQNKKTLFLNLDFESDQPFFLSQNALINKIRLEIGDENGFVFIDEIQRKENAGLFLKGLYDMDLPYKFIVSGSGSLELKENIHESLAGRKRLFEVNTISFEEFVNFKTEYHYQEKLTDFFTLEKEKTKSLLMEYLNFGGYPRVILETSLEEKRKIIDEIYRSFLEKDIVYLLRIEKAEAFSQLIKLMAVRIGRLVNCSELSNTLNLSLKTVQNYLWYAQKTFILEKVPPFFKNPGKEITKASIIYFYDVGLRNYSCGQFGRLDYPEEGFLFQNFIFQLIKEKTKATSASLHFWRTKDKAEVDFVINLGKEIIPVEVKYNPLKTPQAGRSLMNFISKYQPKQAWVINLEYKNIIKKNGTEIHFFPFHELITRSNLSI